MTENVEAYIDLADYKAGSYEVDVHIDSPDSKVNYLVTSKVKIIISAE